MKAKKAIVALGCAALLVVGSVAGTLAYLTSTDEVVNSFTVGNVKIELTEAKVSDPNTGKADTPETRVQANTYHLMPGHTYDKDPTVAVLANSEECYVRMFVTINESTDWDAICDKYENKFGAADMFVGEDNKVWIPKGNTENLAANDTRTYEFWYNTTVPKSTNKTILPDLFTQITMPGDLDNDDLASLDGFKMYVVAQAIQKDGFETADAAFEKAPTLTADQLMPETN